MNIILLSGGSGKKLWPLSNDVRSKQFIKLFKNSRNEQESMIQRVYRQIMEIDAEVDVTVATSKSQASTVISQLGHRVGISVEPDRRDTFPAIILALEYLKDVKNVSLDESIVVCPVDLYADDSFFESFLDLAESASDNSDGITLLGTVPKEASTRYGYIVPQSKDKLSAVSSFVEKPNAFTAARMIENGALWNAGVVSFRLGHVLEIAHSMLDYQGYDDLFSRYPQMPSVSFDRAVLEKEKGLKVLACDSRIRDLGTWAAITEMMPDAVIGKAVLSSSCRNVNVINDMDIPVLAIDLKDLVISASQQGILVTSKTESIDISPFVDHIGQTVMFAEKSWGSLKVLDVSDESMTIKLYIHAGKRMSYHSHEHRDEMWMIVSGEGKTVVDGMEQPVHPGDVITMEAGCRHTIKADTDLEVIEVQRGESIRTSDKKKYELE